MYESEDVDANAFTGVPVFQAEGLIVKTDKAKYTPLFFNKEDLDAAVGNAYQERETHREVTNKAHSNRAMTDLEAAQKKVESPLLQGTSIRTGETKCQNPDGPSEQTAIL